VKERGGGDRVPPFKPAWLVDLADFIFIFSALHLRVNKRPRKRLKLTDHGSILERRGNFLLCARDH
jgi:hypothetical protein